MDRPDGRRDNEGNKPKEVVGCGSGRIRHEGALALGTNGDDDTDKYDRFDTSVISSSASEYSICPIKGGGRGDKSNE